MAEALLRYERAGANEDARRQNRRGRAPCAATSFAALARAVTERDHPRVRVPFLLARR
jgi:hypothetical protein